MVLLLWQVGLIANVKLHFKSFATLAKLYLWVPKCNTIRGRPLMIWDGGAEEIFRGKKIVFDSSFGHPHARLLMVNP